MKISELKLPKHLYTRTTSPCGTRTKFTFAPDKLVSWAQEGRGDAIANLCRNVYERRIANVNAWERKRLLELEDEWMDAGNDEEMHARKFKNVKHYPITPEDVVREAEVKRASIKKRMAEHQTAIEKLVQDARAFLIAYEAHREEDNMLAYLLAIGAIGAVVYVLMS